MIATSARKHGIHDNDMLHAFNHPMFVDDLDHGFVAVFVDQGRGTTERASATSSSR